VSLWYRVFGRRIAPVAPDEVLAYFDHQRLPCKTEFEPPQDWRQATLVVADTIPLELERFPASEEGIRTELNTWAAFLETCDYSSNNVPLMEHMIQTTQLFNLRCAEDHDNPKLAQEVCVSLCQYLAQLTDGVYQVDEEGFYTPAGVLILPEC